MPGESEEEYHKKIKKIIEYARLDSDLDEPIVPGKSYAYDGLDEYGRLVSTNPGGKVKGYRFESYDSENEKKTKLYEKLFGKEIVKQGIEEAIEDELKVRAEGKLLCSVKAPMDYEDQKKIARYYVGPLDYREQNQFHGKFEGAGSERYTKQQAQKIQKKKEEFSHKEQYRDKIELSISGKMFEGFFYPLIRFGFFDSSDGEHSGAIILSSDYDDMFEHKVDVAAVVPIESIDKDGKKIVENQPICFGLTTGVGNHKTATMIKCFRERHGTSDIDYPSTCLKKELPPMKDVPHFALCLPRAEFVKYRESLACGKLPSRDIQDLINYQIFSQAYHWLRYWGMKKDIPEVERRIKIQQFRRIAGHFSKRLGLDSRGGAKLISSIRQRHPEATRFLYDLPSS